LIVKYICMERTDFVEWLYGELGKRNWRKADLARASGLSSAHITRIMKREQSAGPDACRAIAHALDLPEEFVFRKAGLLSPKPDESEPPSFMDWLRIWMNADDEERDRLLERAEKFVAENRKPKG
jgi:transcriptional regulator with XRE-family HTH domain